jgi:hypothetical protein
MTTTTPGSLIFIGTAPTQKTAQSAGSAEYDNNPRAASTGSKASISSLRASGGPHYLRRWLSLDGLSARDEELAYGRHRHRQRHRPDPPAA